MRFWIGPRLKPVKVPVVQPDTLNVQGWHLHALGAGTVHHYLRSILPAMLAGPNGPDPFRPVIAEVVVAEPSCGRSFAPPCVRTPSLW